MTSGESLSFGKRRKIGVGKEFRYCGQSVAGKKRLGNQEKEGRRESGAW